MPENSSFLSLVADVGGTNTRVALADGTKLRAGSVQRYSNKEYPSLGAVLSAYLTEQGNPDCDGACAALAGPVEDGVGTLTNLDWRIDTVTLAEAAQAETVALLNDLQAQGYGVIDMSSDKLRPIFESASTVPGAPKIVIGVGTGFNIAPVFQLGEMHLVTASESGHVTLPVQTEDDLRLAQFVAQKHGFADVEEVLSGRGVENVYAWLCAEAGQSNSSSAADIFAGFAHGTDPRALETAQIFAQKLGAVAGDLALIHMPYGGIYFIGGVARAFGPHLLDLGFGEAFCAKGRFSDLMKRFNIHVIEDDFAALSGCATYLNGIPRT